MKKKYYNEAIIGNDKIVASFSSKGEMLRLFYPTRDCRQFVDTMYTGVKINDSALIYLHDDINNEYEQYYTEDTNVLNTKIKNTYFNLSILQTDFVCISKNVIIKKLIFTNENNIDLNVNFLIYSKLLSSFNNMIGTRIENDIFMQYSHNYTYCIFSKTPILSYRLNNSQEEVKAGTIQDKDYIGMSEDSAVSFDIGILKPGESKEFEIFIYINNNREKYKFDEIIQNIEKMKQIDVQKELIKTEKYWKNYVKEHDGLEILTKEEKWQKLITGKEIIDETSYEKYLQMKKIYVRSILLFPLLLNKETGGISAALEVDEEKDKSGRYSYCWPRDAVFTAKALNILNMHEEAENFYKIFSKNTQSKTGMWEQRFYTDGKLAPCWGYQIDETASVVFGVYSHYYATRNKKFLEETFQMCEKAIKFLKSYIDFIIKKENYKNEKNQLRRFETNESYDIWEMHEGIHIYSMASIYAAFTSMENIYKELNIQKENQIKELKEYQKIVKEYCLTNLCDKETKILKRNNKDNKMDISILGTVTPFRMLDPNQKEIQNTVQKMNLTLKTYTGGYIRFENDNYIEGINPWVIATLWMTLYNIQIKNKEEAMHEIEFIIKTSTKHGLLAEQIDNKTLTSKWVIGLGWSHAMYIIALYSLSL